MGVNAVPLAARRGSRGVAAFVLSALGVLTATGLVLATDSDPSHVRWPLVFLPVAVCAAPVLVPTREVRIGACVVLGAWCLVTGFTIGFLLLPAWFALLGAVVREDR